MSADAERYVKTCTHPRVKGSARTLLEIIARHILEGQTTTPAIVIDDLAAEMGRHEQTVRRARDVLVESGELSVDGGQGVVARYTLVHLSGTRPIVDAPLPLVGAAAPRRSRPRLPADATPSLFDAEVLPRDRANFVQFARGARSWVWLYFVQIARGARSWGSYFVQIARGARSTALPLDVDDARARDVHTFKNVHTHTAAVEPDVPKPEDPKPPPLIRHPWHVWCGDRVCVPKPLHADLLRKRGRQPHETDADVEAWLFAFYARKSTALPPGDPIANDFTFWRRAYAEEVASPPVRARPPDVTPALPIEEDAPPVREVDEETIGGNIVWSQVLERIETKVNRHSFYSWFRDMVLVADHGAVIEVARLGPSGRDVAAWIGRHYAAVVQEAMDEVRPGTRVEFVVVDVQRQQYG